MNCHNIDTKIILPVLLQLKCLMLMKTENMKAVVEFIRFKYYFKKEINNEIMREISQNHSKKCYLLSAF